MRIAWSLCGLAASPAVAGSLGTPSEAIEWFKSKVPSTVPEVSGETAAIRSYFYVGGKYVEAVSFQLVPGLNLPADDS